MEKSKSCSSVDGEKKLVHQLHSTKTANFDTIFVPNFEKINARVFFFIQTNSQKYFSGRSIR